MRTSSRSAPSIEVLLFVALTCAAMPDAWAYSNQPSLLTGRAGFGAVGCVGCHGPGGMMVTISGPTALEPNELGVYTVSAFSGSPGAARMGVAIATGDAGTPLSVPAGQPLSVQASGRELVHDAALGALPTAASGSAFYTFNYTMPATAAAGSFHDLHAVAALGFAGSWAHANSRSVTTRPLAPAAAVATVTSIGGPSVILSWSGGGPAYRVVYKPGMVAPASPTDGIVVDVGAGTSATLTGLYALYTYSFAVFSATTFGPAIYSAGAATVTATTTAAPLIAATALVSSLNPSAPGQLVTLTATVTSASGTPTGSVTFRDGPVPLCTSVALSAGQAQCATSSLSAAMHWITAEYSGDSIFGSSFSWYLLQLVSSDIGGTTRLGNISTRAQVLTGEDVMIGGFIIVGSNKTVVVRARGPSLVPFGISNALANPQLRLVRSSDQATLVTNDDWGLASNAAAIAASGFAPSEPLEAAILVNLPAGAYTTIVSGAGGGTGVGIIEVFEVDHPEAVLFNLSTRGRVLTGNDVMIAGFVIQGIAQQTVVIRARGPSLIPFGITDPLFRPRLQLVRSSDQALLATNDMWDTASNAAAIAASGFAPSNPMEAAILITLPPGAYTAIVSGVGGTTGVAIVEVFAQ